MDSRSPAHSEGRADAAQRVLNRPTDRQGHRGRGALLQGRVPDNPPLKGQGCVGGAGHQALGLEVRDRPLLPKSDQVLKPRGRHTADPTAGDTELPGAESGTIRATKPTRLSTRHHPE